MTTTPMDETTELERAGRRSGHGSSADAWEGRERSESINRALALLPPELQRRIQDPRTVISPLVVAEQAKAMEQAFQALCDNVLTDEDYAWYRVKEQKIVELAGGMKTLQEVEVLKKRKRKSAWRKLARYFNVDLEILREVIGHRHDANTCSRIVLSKAGVQMRDDEDCSCPTTYARFHFRVIAANGRVGWGVGIASANERGFKAQDHSLPATAASRGISRAISDMIGAGEASSDDPAETTDAPEGEPRATVARAPIADGKALTEDQVKAYQTAWGAASADQRRNAIRHLSELGYAPGQFTAHGAIDYDVIMDMLGAGMPEEAPL